MSAPPVLIRIRRDGRLLTVDAALPDPLGVGCIVASCALAPEERWRALRRRLTHAVHLIRDAYEKASRR